MRKINHKSDFDFILPFPVREALPDGTCRPVDLGWPDFDWEARLWTWSKANMFVASCKGGVPTNCFNDNGRIHVVLDNHRLGAGKLRVEYHAELPNGIYPDATRDMFNEYPLGVELVDGPGDCATEVEVDYMLPYIKGDKGEKGDQGDPGPKGDPFTYDDFTPDEIALLQKPAKDAADGLSTFATEARRAEETRASNEEARVEAETRRSTRFDEFETDLAKKADRSELSNVLAADPLEPWERPDTPEYRRAFIDMWNEACVDYPQEMHKQSLGGFNEETGLCVLSEVTLTWPEAQTTLAAGRPQGSTINSYLKCNKDIRVNLPSREMNHTVDYPFYYCRKLEVANAHRMIFRRPIYGCPALHTINGLVDVSFPSSVFLCDQPTLRSLSITRLSKPLNLGNQPLLTADSFRGIISGAADSPAITVHPDVYAKLTDPANAEWNALLALAAERNVTFTTIE